MRLSIVLLAVLLAVLAAGCGSAGQVPAQGHHTVPHHSGVPHGLSARIVLTTQTMTAGSEILGRVVVTNDTGRAIHTTGCGTLFQIVLTSREYHPSVAWASCLQQFTIPVGTSRYPVTVLARYLRCSEDRSPGSGRACLPGGGMPPLPAGSYRARVFQSRQLIEVLPSVPVRVTPGAPAGG